MRNCLKSLQILLLLFFGAAVLASCSKKEEEVSVSNEKTILIKLEVKHNDGTTTNSQVYAVK